MSSGEDDEENLLWLIVQKKSKTESKRRLLELVSYKDLINASLPLHTGQPVLLKAGTSTRQVEVVHFNDDKHFLESQLRSLRAESRQLKEEQQQVDVSDISNAGDFSCSGSEWHPKDHTSSESEDEFLHSHRGLGSNTSSNRKLSFDTKGPIVDGAYHQNIGLTIKMLTEYLGNTVERLDQDTNQNDDYHSSARSKMSSLHEALQSQLNALVHEEESLSIRTSDRHTQTLDSGDIITRAVELANIFKLSEDILEALQVRKNHLQSQINETHQQLMALKKQLRQTVCAFPNGNKGDVKIMSEKLTDIKIRKYERKLNRAMIKSNIKIIRNELISAESNFSDPMAVRTCNKEREKELQKEETSGLERNQSNNNSNGHCSKYESTPDITAVSVEQSVATDPYCIEIEFPSSALERNAVADNSSKGGGHKSKTAHRTSSDQISSSNRTSTEIINSVNDQGMVPIGTGQTFINSYEYAQLNWNSHTMATRKLLLAVFTRKELATHSLTGKPSPAFVNKPTKLQLDPVKINDIIIEVSKGCRVQPRYVRSAITTKCADENKMRKIRLRKGKRKRKTESDESADNRNIESQENINPQIQS